MKRDDVIGIAMIICAIAWVYQFVTQVLLMPGLFIPK